MRVGIQGWGSEGDNRPMLALAGALRRAGHEVRVVLTNVDAKDYSSLAASLDVPLQVVPRRMDFSLPTVAGDAGAVDPLKLSRQMNEQALNPFLDELYASALELCASSDVVVWNLAAWYVKAAALKAQVPSVAVHYYPGLAPSRIAPPGGFPDWGPLNRLFWLLGSALLDLGKKRPAQFFAQKGLPPLRHLLPDLLFSEQLNLLAASPAFYPPAPDWAPRYQVVGDFPVPDGAEAWAPSAALRQFLEAGDKPILCSFGSMEHLAPARARDLLLTACRQARVRAIVQTKRGPAEEGQDQDLFFLPWAPHRSLLPHCRALVHHGGAGTSHAALRAGVPSVVVPFIFEQKLWARQLRLSGTAHKPLSFWKAQPAALAERIRQALASDDLARRASALSSELAREDGLSTAVSLLEQLAASTGKA